MFLSPWGMPAWHSSLLSTEESQGFWISQDTRAQGTSWTDDDNLLKAAFGRMLEWVHGGNVLFQCQPCAGNSNQTSHNNDTFTRWLIRYQLDELSLGNLYTFMWQITQESGWGKKNEHDTFQNYDADYSWYESEHTQLGEMTPAGHRMGRRDERLTSQAYKCLVWASCWSCFHTIRRVGWSLICCLLWRKWGFCRKTKPRMVTKETTKMWKWK